MLLEISAIALNGLRFGRPAHADGGRRIIKSLLGPRPSCLGQGRKQQAAWAKGGIEYKNVRALFDQSANEKAPSTMTHVHESIRIQVLAVLSFELTSLLSAHCCRPIALPTVSKVLRASQHHPAGPYEGCLAGLPLRAVLLKYDRSKEASPELLVRTSL